MIEIYVLVVLPRDLLPTSRTKRQRVRAVTPSHKVEKRSALDVSASDFWEHTQVKTVGSLIGATPISSIQFQQLPRFNPPFHLVV